jgi:hypothetical protein
MFCLAGALLLAQLPACATEVAGRRPPVTMSIIDRETGQALTEYRKDGRAYVAGRPAARYALRVSNGSSGRVLVVLSVDGVNVISGETAAVGQTGYVLDPGQTHDITGWRKSDTAIAAFVFAALADAYAVRTGRPDHVGVIGMAVFLEKPAPAPAPAVADMAARAEAVKSESAPRGAAPAMRMAESDRLGTAHGPREWSVSRRTSFERLSPNPQAVVEIAYDSHANLVLAGVIPRPTAQARAFPLDDARGYVPDPPTR